MAITTASQSQIGQDTAKNSQVVTTVVKNFNSGTLGSGPSITSVVVTDSSYNTLDDTAVTTSNGYIKIIGTGFTSTANVYIGSSAVPAANVTFVSSTEIRARVPVLSVGNYSLSLFNSNSSGTISSSTFIVSTGPAWVTGATLSNQVSDTAFAVALSATSDTSIIYANTTALPSGTTLAANGYFSGTVSIGSQTTYTFDVKATDIENQDNTRTFSLTVIVSNPNLYSWGQNNEGQLGLNDRIYRSSPVQIGTESTWNKVSSFSSNVLATKTDGTLWSWGKNDAGQLGINNTAYRSSPTQIGTFTNWDQISAGSASSFFTNTGRQLWATGRNANGELGLNDRIYKSSPVQVGSATNWSLISSRTYSSAGITLDGTLWTWGLNNYGQLGNSQGIMRSSPVQVGALTNWSKVKVGTLMMSAIKTDGTLWVWGSNDLGQLGNNNNQLVPSPVQLGTATNWSLVTTGTYCAFAIKTNGTLWGWGFNNQGQLGINDTIWRSSPVQIGTDTNWSLVETGSYTVIATKTDGTLWSWGRNNHGQVGVNNLSARSSPVQIGTDTNWKQTVDSITISSRASIATKQ
jgi:alpha-tubulin suppressor-like RCC1 family protein